MRAMIPWLGAVLAAAAASSLAQANPYFPPPHPYAPDACGPGYYCSHPCGMVYGPNYCLQPCGLPFNGLLVAPQPRAPRGAPMEEGYGGPPSFPTHPYARGPRDFFMIYENEPDLRVSPRWQIRY
jgi:hypothetical protein